MSEKLLDQINFPSDLRKLRKTIKSGFRRIKNKLIEVVETGGKVLN